MRRTTRASILGNGVRNALLILLVTAALVGPSTVLAGTSTKGDGTLSVKDASGIVTIAARGIVFGRVDNGWVRIVDYRPDDTNSFEDFGTCDITRFLDDHTTLCKGTGLRFRFAAGKFDVRVGGRGLNLTAVGKGTGTIDGADTAPDPGTYSVNGGAFEPLPFFASSFVLGQPTPVAGG
jgi:hypothetical protein